MEELINHMIFCGWAEEPSGKVSHEECGTFDSWKKAIESCIEVASGV